MKQLGILDSAFINLEQTNTPQHIGGLGIYDPSTAPGGFVRFKDVISSIERRLDRQPMFRTRLIEVPGGLDRPYWVKDANFDVEFHLRHIALPEPGDWRQLCIQVARLHSRPLDMSRPLWEAYIIEGLDNIPNLPAGCFAIYTKMHHSLVDGAGGSAFMSLIHDTQANPSQENEPADAPRLVDLQPSVSELLSKASINSFKNTSRLLRGSVRQAIDLGRFALDVVRKELPAPDIKAPKTRFNRSVGPHRVFDAAEFPLQCFRDIKDAGGVTVNDVALAVIGGALQGYLVARDEAPDKGALAAAIPLNLRTRRGETDDNNQAGSVFASLHTDIAEPMTRLQAVHVSAAEAKRGSEQNPLVDSLMIAGVFSPLIAKTVAGIWSRNDLSSLLPVNVSTCISNVPGPDFPLFCAGAKLVEYYGLGVLTPSIGIFHLVFSYADKITVSVLADRDIMPDPEFYHDCLVSSYEELYIAARAVSSGGSAKSAETTRARTGIDYSRRKRGTEKPETTTGARNEPGRKTREAPVKKAASAARKKQSPAKKAPAAKETPVANKAPAAKKSALTKKKAPVKKRAAKRRPKTADRPKVKPKLRNS